MAAPVLAASGAHAGNPTTAPTGTFGTTASGDILIVLVTNGGADTAPGSLTGTSVSTGGLTWTKKTDLGGGALTDLNGSLWWARASGNHTGQTVIAATTNSGSLVWGQVTGAITSGDPFDNATSVLNASGVNAITGYTPGSDETLVILGLFTDDNIVSATYTTTGSPATLTEAQDAGSTGGADTQVALASGQQTTAASIGVVSWSNARGAGIYQVAILATIKKPTAATITGTMAASFGGLTASMTGGELITGTMVSAFGGLSASATGTRTVNGTMAAGLGGLTATAIGKRTVLGTMAGVFGGLSGTMVGGKLMTGTMAASFGGLSGTMAGTRVVNGLLVSSYGGLTALLVGRPYAAANRADLQPSLWDAELPTNLAEGRLTAADLQPSLWHAELADGLAHGSLTAADLQPSLWRADLQP